MSMRTIFLPRFIKTFWKRPMGAKEHPSYALRVMGDALRSRDPSFCQTVLDMIRMDTLSSTMKKWMLMFRMGTIIWKETTDGRCRVALSK